MMKNTERKAIVSWALYDWANSAFATTVMAGFFPVFFKQYWSAGTDAVVSTARLGAANSTAGVIIALSAPVLGAMADRGSARKTFLLFFAFLGILMTFCLYLVPQGAWVVAAAVYTLAVIGFSGGNTFYDSLLPGVARPDRLHSVSALGFALGYLGGGILFALNVWITLKPEFFGFTDASASVRFSFLSVGLWWMLFSLPLILFVREPGSGNAAYGADMVKAGFRQLRETFREIRHQKTIFLFLTAYWLYIDGVDTIVRMAVDYGLSLGFKAGDLILALLITQFIAFPSALAFGFLGRRIGAKRAIYIAIGVYLFISLWGAFITGKNEFHLLAAIIGLVQGGIQALSRSFYAGMIPEGRSAEYFGFYNMLGKFAAIIGPVLIGTVGLVLSAFGMEGTRASRYGITSIAVLFLAGGILLYFVDEKEGMREAGRMTNMQG